MKKLPLVLLLSFIINALYGQTSSFTYLVRQPKTKSPNPPLIILMHGYGADEFDLFSIVDRLPDRFLIISPRGPYTVPQGGFSWYRIDPPTGLSIISNGNEKKSRDIAAAFIRSLKDKFQYDSTRVYLCGFSQGAMMSLSIGLTHPRLVRGVAMMSGRLFEQVKPDIALVDSLQSIRVLITHGINDAQVPVADGRAANEYLRSIGINPVYKEYSDGHTVSPKMVADLVKWLKD